MTDPRRPRLLALVPGLHRIADGRWGTGAFVLLAWALALWTLMARWDRVAALPYGGLDEWVALVALVATVAGAWTWSSLDGGPRPTAAARSQWDLASRAFSRNGLAVTGLMAIGLFYLLAVLTPFLAPTDPAFQGELATQRYLAPSLEHPLGTDRFARDVLSRLLYGARVSLSIGFIAVSISVSLGTLIGAVSGYLGGRWDAIIMRFVDTVVSFPRLVLLITIVALFEPSIFLIIAVLGLTQWPYISRIVRGEVLSLREREFVQAARALGYSRRRIILRHVVPNTLAPVIVAATLGIGNTIVLEAGLSFLGIGIQPPDPSWGNMMNAGRGQLLDAWWITTFPGLAIVMTVLSLNLVGDGLRDALDPRLRARGIR